MAECIVVHGIKIRFGGLSEKFGKLTVIGPSFRLRKWFHVVCDCECGSSKVVCVDNLKNGTTESCGCLKKEIAKSNAKHGLSKSYFNEALVGIKQRCFNPKDDAYSSYGARGIRVCDRWLGPDGLANFASDMGERPSPKHSIDRKENDGDYCPDNCRWATRQEQAQNRRSTRSIEFNGKTQCLTEWAREIGVAQSTLSKRLGKGWSLERALCSKQLSIRTSGFGSLLTTKGKQ